MSAWARRLGFEIALVPRLLADFRAGPWPHGLFALGVVYAVLPAQLIAQALPWGGSDRLAALIFAWAGLRFLSPARQRREDMAPGWIEAVQFRLRLTQGDLGNFFLIHHRTQDGFLVSGKNSGTHWLKFMLNVAFSSHFGVAPPRHSSGENANHIVGGPKDARIFADLPHFASSHSIPSGFFCWGPVWKHARRRPIVVLVRTIPEALESNYAKWQDQYAGDLEDFARGDPLRKRYSTDAWWYIHFFNRWGDIARAHPGSILFVRYDELRRDPAAQLTRIAAHFGIVLLQKDIDAAMALSGRDTIRALQDARYGEEIVPADEARAKVKLGPREQAILDAILARHLRFDTDFG